MTFKKHFTITELENITGLECIFEDDRPNGENFFDDMVAHILVGGFRFCIDIEKETDKEVVKARKRLEKVFEKEDIVVCSICGCLIKWIDSNNAKPINDWECCNDCNTSKVIPARMK